MRVSEQAEVGAKTPGTGYLLGVGGQGASKIKGNSEVSGFHDQKGSGGDVRRMEECGWRPGVTFLCDHAEFAVVMGGYERGIQQAGEGGQDWVWMGTSPGSCSTKGNEVIKGRGREQRGHFGRAQSIKSKNTSESQAGLGVTTALPLAQCPRVSL